MDVKVQIAITIFGTIVSGVIVFTVSQIIVQKFVKPYEDYRLLKSNVAFVLVMYANLYCNPANKNDEISDYRKEKYNLASDETRKMAAEISAFRQRKTKKGFGIPSDEDLKIVTAELVSLSNSYFISPIQNVYKEMVNNRNSANNIIKIMALDLDL